MHALVYGPRLLLTYSCPEAYICAAVVVYDVTGMIPIEHMIESAELFRRRGIEPMIRVRRILRGVEIIS